MHSVWRPETVLTGGVWDTFLAVPPLLGRPLRARRDPRQRGRDDRARARRLLPGGRDRRRRARPGGDRVGRRYFGLGDNPRLTVHDADARPFLRRTDERYDLIVVDAYHQPYVPFYLATREFFQLVRERLAPGGHRRAQRRDGAGRRPPARRDRRDAAAELTDGRRWPALRFNKIVLGARPRRLAPRRRLRGVPGASSQPLAVAARARPRLAGGAVRRPVDGRPRAGRVGDRPDDRRVRGPRRRARRGLPPDRAAMIEAAARGRPAHPGRASGRGRARAGEHAPLLRRGGRGRASTRSSSTCSTSRGPLVARALGRPRRGEPRRGARAPFATARSPSCARSRPELPTLDEALAWSRRRTRGRAARRPQAARRGWTSSRRRSTATAWRRGRWSAPSTAEPAAVAGHAAPEIRDRLHVSEDRYGISRRRALRPVIRLVAEGVAAALARRVPAHDRARRAQRR